MRRKGPERDAEKERFWREVIRRQRRSGQSVRGFCRDEALSEPSFYAWRRELKQRGGKQQVRRSQRSVVRRPIKTKCSAANRPAFVAVQLAGKTGQMATGAGQMAAGKIELALPSGAVLRLPSGMEPAAVAAIINAWEQRR